MVACSDAFELTGQQERRLEREGKLDRTLEKVRTLKDQVGAGEVGLELEEFLRSRKSRASSSR